MTIFITCIGLFGSIEFSMRKRIKEIGIRKVVGASMPGILSMLAKDFTKWILLANIFAWPVAWYIMSKWLQNFAYHIDLTFLPFLMAGLFVLFFALLSVSWLLVRAATANPVEALKYE